MQTAIPWLWHRAHKNDDYLQWQRVRFDFPPALLTYQTRQALATGGNSARLMEPYSSALTMPYANTIDAAELVEEADSCLCFLSILGSGALFVHWKAERGHLWIAISNGCSPLWWHSAHLNDCEKGEWIYKISDLCSSHELEYRYPANAGPEGTAGKCKVAILTHIGGVQQVLVQSLWSEDARVQLLHARWS